MLKAQQRFSSLTQESSGCTDADLQGCYRQKQSNMSFLTNSKIHFSKGWRIPHYKVGMKSWQLKALKAGGEQTCSVRFTQKRATSGSAGRFVYPLRSWYRAEAEANNHLHARDLSQLWALPPASYRVPGNMRQHSTGTPKTRCHFTWYTPLPGCSQSTQAPSLHTGQMVS